MFRRHAQRTTAGIPEDLAQSYWVARPGDRVMTREGFPGRVESVYDGPQGGNETYIVALDNNMGGGEYGPNEISPLSQSQGQQAAVVTAADDYPELAEILTDRLPPVDRRTASLHTARSVDWQAMNENYSCDNCGFRGKMPPPADGVDRCPQCGHTEPYTAIDAQGWPLDKTAVTTGGIFQHLLDHAVDNMGDNFAKNMPGLDERYPAGHAPSTHDWCRFRRDSRCFYARDLDPDATKQAGYAVWIPEDRGYCPRESWAAQQQCPVSEPGPNVPGGYTDATISWEQGGQRGHAAPPYERHAPTNPTTSALAVTADPEFAFHFTAAWRDVRAKAARISRAGQVRFLTAPNDPQHLSITAEVQGDTDVYQTTITRVPGKTAVAFWECGCAWSAYSWGRTGRWKRFEGRMCSHALATVYAAQRSEMGGGTIDVVRYAPTWRDPSILPKTFFDKDKGRSVASAHSAVSALAGASSDPEDVAPAVEYAQGMLSDRVSALAVLNRLATLGCPDPTAILKVAVNTHFPAQYDGQMVLVTVDGNGHTYANGQPVDPRLLVYPTYTPTLGLDPRDATLHEGAVHAVVPGETVALCGYDTAQPKREGRGAERGCPECMAKMEDGRPYSGIGDTESRSILDMLGAKKDDGPSVSGVALKARDTGRILMLQRGLGDEKDPAAGTWEFPGGHHEDGDQTSLHAGIREWEEEVGQKFPEGGVVSHTWRSPNGLYQGHVVVIPEEKAVCLHQGRDIDNPDDPDGDESEQVAWWHPDDARKNPALRKEVKETPWDAVKKAATLATVANGEGLPLDDAVLPAVPGDAGGAGGDQVAPCRACSGTGEQGTGHECYMCDSSGLDDEFDPAEDNSNPENGLLVGRRDDLGIAPITTEALRVHFDPEMGSYEMIAPAKKERLGNCYENAAKHAVFGADEPVPPFTKKDDRALVHGTIQGEGLPPLGHAWVAYDDGRVYEPTGDHVYSGAAFKTLFHPTERVRYRPDEAAVNMVRHRHYGPWDEEGLSDKVARTITMDEMRALGEQAVAESPFDTAEELLAHHVAEQERMLAEAGFGTTATTDEARDWDMDPALRDDPSWRADSGVSDEAWAFADGVMETYHALQAGAEADLHDEPEPALPSTDGAEDDESGLDATAGLTQESRAWIMNGARPGESGATESGQISDSDIALAAKQALKAFTPAEQKELIEEGERDGVTASNLDILDIAGTHYMALEESLRKQEVAEDEVW